MPPADDARERVAHEQRELMSALSGQGDAPAFAQDRLAIQAASLRSKRAYYLAQAAGAAMSQARAYVDQTIQRTDDFASDLRDFRRWLRRHRAAP